ncbi:hypothetical protein P8452_53321 [Trifolium repens]|nr:hypothetical protein P8452_53321 [Trifolium repens]
MKDFLDFAFSRPERPPITIRCPCCRCNNVNFKTRAEVDHHLYQWGFEPSYENWEYHGESSSDSSDDSDFMDTDDDIGNGADHEMRDDPQIFDMLYQMHRSVNANGEWINDDSKKVHTKVQERCSELLELGYMDEDKDKLINTTFEEVVGVRSGYSRGLGAGIKPQKGKNVAGLLEELKKECEKRQDIEKKLKDVETQRQQELKMMEEMTAKIEESQRQLEESQRQLREKVDKQVEAKVATMLRQMLNIPVSI